MRSCWLIQVGPTSNNRYSYERHMRAGEKPCEDRDRDGRDVAISPGRLESPEVGGAGRTFPWRLWRERGPARPGSRARGPRTEKTPSFRSEACGVRRSRSISGT